MEPQPSLPHDPASDISDASAAAIKPTDDDTPTDTSREAAAAPLEIEAANLTPQATDRHDDGDVDGLSPSVRRLVRQYDLDVTRIRGTGPEGRIRVADVVALIGTRSDAPGDAALRYATARLTQRGTHDGEAEHANTDAADTDLAAAADRDARAELAAAVSRSLVASAPPAAPVTTVFECDLGRVLAHRKRQAQDGVEPTITSYYLVACGAALEAVPEVGAGSRFGEVGVWLATSDGDAKPLLIDIAAEPPGTPPGLRVQSIDLRIRAAATAVASAANPDDDPFLGATTSMLVHQYGASGSLLTTGTPLGPGHAASLGIGRVRKQIVVRSVDGDEGPRVAALAYLTLTFDPRRVTLPRANRFMAELVRVLEQWPED